ncbi:MAG: carboxypeptidase M32 [Alphaproteobacteria bacterium]
MSDLDLAPRPDAAQPSTPAYTRLHDRFAEMDAINGAVGVLDWDRSTFMPEGGSEARGKQLTALSLIRHRMITDPALGDWFNDAAEEQSAGKLTDWQAANLREMKHRWVHETALPEDLVAAFTAASNTGEMTWREARANSDWKLLEPAMAEIIRLNREAAAVKSEALGVSPYEAMMDKFEPGLREDRVKDLFDDLAAFLPGAIEQAMTHQSEQREPHDLGASVHEDAQREMALELMKVVGFDFNRGRLDTSLHPFCGGTPSDVRITTRYNEADPFVALMGVMHETGHAMYELGLPGDWLDQPVGSARGMTLHESQSLLVEMQAGRSWQFMQWMAGRARHHFHREGPAWEAEELYRRLIHVKPDFIRVDADEITYPAHIILRTRMEQAMIGGQMEAADMPGAINDGMKELLGITPPDDRRGVLQDIHWPSGWMGYFPTYTLGALSAAQLFTSATAERPEILTELQKGSFATLMQWLGEKVHSRASFHATSDEVLEQATGSALTTEAWKAHIGRRYLGQGDQG